ncbi:1150_t:CDS:2, partial [Ambispora leptoticha]
PQYESLGNYADREMASTLLCGKEELQHQGFMDHPSKKTLEKYGSKVIDIVRVLENEDVSNLSTINARNKCDWTGWIIVGEGKGSRQLGNLVNGVYKMLNNKLQQHTEKTDPIGSLIVNYSIIEGRDSNQISM